MHLEWCVWNGLCSRVHICNCAKYPTNSHATLDTEQTCRCTHDVMASYLRPRCGVVVVAATLVIAFIIVLQPVRGLINDDDVCGSRKTCYDCMCADGGLSPCDSTGRQSCAWCGGSCVQRSLTSSLQCGDSGDVYPPSSSYNDDDMRPTVEAQCDVPARKPNLTPCCDASLFPNHSLTSPHFSFHSIGNGCLYNSQSARGQHCFGYSPYSSLCPSPQPVTRSSGEATDTTGNNPMLPVCLTPPALHPAPRSPCTSGAQPVYSHVPRHAGRRRAPAMGWLLHTMVAARVRRTESTRKVLLQLCYLLDCLWCAHALLPSSPGQPCRR